MYWNKQLWFLRLLKLPRRIHLWMPSEFIMESFQDILPKLPHLVVIFIQIRCVWNCSWVDFVNLKSQSCEIETEDACNSNGNPCIKGKCIPIGKNNYRCECIDGYEGEKVCKHVCRNKATCGTGPKSGICVEAEDTYLCICNSEGKYYVIIT